MALKDDLYDMWRTKEGEREGSLLQRQLLAMKAMQDENVPVMAKPELIADRVYSGFKLGALAGLLAAAGGGALGAVAGVPTLGATLGGYVGLLGGNIKGQADANKRFLKKENFDPKLINLLRFVGPNRGTALTVTNLIPDPGHLSV